MTPKPNPYYVSLDIETTGLDPDLDQILEIGAVIDDLKRPVKDLAEFHCYVMHERVFGSAYALSMHPKILRRIATKESGYRYLKPEEIVGAFLDWLLEQGVNPKKHHLTMAGKNFASFDRQFLKQLRNWDIQIPMRHRSIDPGNLFWLPHIDGVDLPSTATCMKRAGIEGEVAHTALEDARVVVKLIRNQINQISFNMDSPECPMNVRGL